MAALADAVDSLAESERFSGVVSVSRANVIEFERAYGLADRRHGVACTVDTMFAIASGTKGFTAVVVSSLIADGRLELSSTARSLLGPDLPLIPDDVTVEHLLAHRSGIGDYVDEDADREVPLKVPVQQLDSAEAYLPALDGFPVKFAADRKFSYCNGGYAVLAILAERAARQPFQDLVADRVFEPAGMVGSGFPHSDELPRRAATGYLTDGDRTNVFRLPVRGTGDGGAYSTPADVRAFWLAMFDGRLGSTAHVGELVRPRSDVPKEAMRYGLGFWLHPSGPTVILVGYDYGVSFHSAHDPTTGLTHTVMANTAEGAWPISRLLRETLTP